MTLPPPLAIVQARMRSTRLPGKVMLPLADGRPMLAWSVGAAIAAFGREHVVVATGSLEHNAEIVEWCREHKVEWWVDSNRERDVLGRFYFAAKQRRWRGESVIVRVTADDPFKKPEAMRRVASGERLAVEIGAEAFTLDMLIAAHKRIPRSITNKQGEEDVPVEREHLSLALFSTEAPTPGDGRIWTVDNQDDYAMALERSVTEISYTTDPRYTDPRKRPWLT